MTSEVRAHETRKRRRDEAPLTLEEPAPRVLGFWDQGAFWANLGVSLFAFSGAYTVLAPDANGKPTLPIAAGIVAMIVGTVLGGLMLGLAAAPGARTGRPAMVLLRGLFGVRLSYVPTVLNIAQLVGWGTFELIVIADAARANRGDALAAKLAPARVRGAFPELPFGSDLTSEEVELARALKWLKLRTASWRDWLAVAGQALATKPQSARSRAALERMGLADAAGVRERIERRLVSVALRASKPA